MRLARLVLVLVVVLMPSPARSSVPDPSRSTIDSVLIACPQGDATYHVTIRYLSDRPYAGGSLVLATALCSGIHFCPALETDDYLELPGVGVLARTPTGVDGRTQLSIRAGGPCPDAAMDVYVDGVPMGVLHHVASPDQDGDLTVGAADIDAISAHLGQPYGPADLDGDGLVTPADVALALQHLGHTCAAATPARPRSWGRLKQHYR